MNIPFHQVDLSGPYRQRVVDYMFAEYEKGRTPNPDVLCNREIKFDSFAEEARKLGGDFVATGHYCRKEEIHQVTKLFTGFFQVRTIIRIRAIFFARSARNNLQLHFSQIGDLTKPEVRKIAEKLGLATAQRKDSQGICFVGKVHLPTFLQQKLEGEKRKYS